MLLKPRQKRVYSPRTIVPTVSKVYQPDPTPKGSFAWVSFLLNKSQSWIIQQTGPDGYFFLRYLFILCVTFFCAALFLLPILLPVNATNGNPGSRGFDIISFSNVKNKNRFFAHVFLSWIFFGGIIYMIYRELYYYVSFKHAWQTSPYIDSLISTKTLLISRLPGKFVDDEQAINTLFPAATSITFARDYKSLAKDVKKRTKLAKKYEAALNKVVNKSVATKKKLVKKGKPLPEVESNPDSFLKKLPTHRLKPIIGKKVETLKYATEELPKLNKSIKEQQDEYLHAAAKNSVFLQFNSQLELQRALQSIHFNKELRFVHTAINVTPEDIVWSNLDITNSTRLVRKTGAVCVLVLMLIYWAIPVAVVGCISNINYLTEKVPFLRFINNMPAKLMGIITGVLPSVLLSILMSLVPPFIKLMGKLAGLVTLQEIDLWCQHWYFAFQVIEVFLVTTGTSSASSTVTQIIENPSNAMFLLAQNLPKSSNFYIAYILLQGLTIPGGALLQVVTLILAQILGPLLDKTPRSKWNRFNSLSSPSWGVVYPVYGLIILICIVYTMIAPIIIAFGICGIALVYFAYLYNLVYVNNLAGVDNRGRNYPRALFQLFVGLYLAEICLIGLFVMAKSWGPFALEIVMLAVTVCCHIYFKWMFVPLYDEIPISGIYEAAGNPDYKYPWNRFFAFSSLKEISVTGRQFWALEGDADFKNNSGSPVAGGNEEDGEKNPHNHLDSSIEKKTVDNMNNENSSNKSHVSTKSRFAGIIHSLLHPNQTLRFSEVRKILPDFLNQPVVYTPEQVETFKYVNPAVTDAEPQFWIAKDPMGISQTLISECNGLLVTDENTEFNEKGKAEFLGPPPDYEEAVAH